MKLSISLSTLLLVLPAIVAASGPLDMRAIDDLSYFPGNHARQVGRQFGRQRNGAQQQGQQQAQQQGGKQAAASGAAKNQTGAAAAAGNGNKQQQAAASAAAANKGKQGQAAASASTTAAAKSSSTAAAAASNTAAAAAANGKNNKGGKNNNNAAAAAAASSSSAAAAAASSSAAAATAANGKNNNKGGKNNNNNAAAAASSSAAAAAAASSSSAAAAATASAAANGKNNKGGKNNNNAAASSSAAAAASSSAAAAASSSSEAAASASSSAAANKNNNNNNNPDTSLTLLQELVATNLAQDGQATQEAGQVASLTSTNNFINFCSGKTITNGQQITTGSCNPVPMGDIVPKANMPASKFKFPKNFSTIPANKAFTIEMNLINLQAGVFTNAQKTYYMAPQQLNGQKILIGHTHFVIQPMGNFDDPSILDPATFTFFKGINTAAVNGVVSADVTAGVPPGNYRLASINTDSNHAPAIVAVAQHGFCDDMIYFTAK